MEHQLHTKILQAFTWSISRSRFQLCTPSNFCLYTCIRGKRSRTNKNSLSVTWIQLLSYLICSLAAIEKEKWPKNREEKVVNSPLLIFFKTKSMLMKCNYIYLYTLHNLYVILKGGNIKDQAVVCFSYVGPISHRTTSKTALTLPLANIQKPCSHLPFHLLHKLFFPWSKHKWYIAVGSSSELASCHVDYTFFPSNAWELLAPTKRRILFAKILNNTSMLRRRGSS